MHSRATWAWVLAFTAVGVVVSGCSSRGRRPGGGGVDGGGRNDASMSGADGGAGSDGGGSINPCAPGCGPMELCGELNQGNGLDDNCNGSVDEGCTCPATNVTRPCFAGPPDRRNVGACSDGIETCDEFLQWSACTGGVSPMDETCDGTDNDCNGLVDDVPGCSSPFTCPDNDYSPPLTRYSLRGGRVYAGAGSNWTWRVECPASVPADLCPDPEAPTSKDTAVYFTASGAYRVFVEATGDSGENIACAWTVYVQGTGLRVELNWDTMLDTEGGTDVDLHLHRWTRNGVDTPFFDDDDCYFANCVPPTEFFGLPSDDIEWSDHAPSPLANCEDAPHGGGAKWREEGNCRNPRLDVDTNGVDGPCSASVRDPNDSAFCAPENINVDNPILGMPYRVLVNYYSDSGFAGMTNVSVNIYCGGALRAAFGLDPLVYLRNGEGAGSSNESWHVADVVFFNGVCGQDCMVYPLGAIQTGAEFGDPWSCDYDASAGTCTPR